MGQLSSSVPFLERREIDQKAAEQARSTAGVESSWDAFDVARRNAIPVIRTVFNQPDIAGMLVRDGERTEIRVRRDDSYARQNFTVAHELGHLVLHPPGTWEDTPNTMYRRSAWSGDGSRRRAEYQANLFAAARLMPEAVIRERWHQFRSVPYLAPQFRVSKRAISRRLEELGLIVLTPKGIHFFDLSGWDARSGVPELPPISDDRGPIPHFPPIATDELGRIIPMSDEEWAARSSALTRVLRTAGDRTDETSRAEGGELEETGD